MGWLGGEVGSEAAGFGPESEGEVEGEGAEGEGGSEEGGEVENEAGGMEVLGELCRQCSPPYRWHLLILWGGRKIQPLCGGGQKRVFFPIPVLLVGCES